MHTYKNLYTKIITWENLLLAAKKAQKGKRMLAYVAYFNNNLENELLQLQKQLENKTYKPGSYSEHYIYEPKKRMISAAPYRDRVVHHALCNIIEPIFEKTFVFDNYANRKYKGTHAAVDRYREFAKKYTYVFKADIRKFFPSIVHTILKNEIRKKIACPNTLWLIDLIIDNSNLQEPVFWNFPTDDLFTYANMRLGLPMGNLTSQFFANIYLNAFDHFVKENLKAKAYIRYVDDFVLFSNNKTELQHWKMQIISYLEKYRLKLHPTKNRIYQTADGVQFLGFRIFPAFILLGKESKLRAIRRLTKKYYRFNAGKITISQFHSSANSWCAHAKNADTFRLRTKILSKFAEVLAYDEYFKGFVFRTKV